jgi:hypothetical protein
LRTLERGIQIPLQSDAPNELPKKIRLRRFFSRRNTVARVLIRLCGVTAALLLASTAAYTDKSYASLVFGGSCPGATQAFAQWGDPHFYVFGANGGLESGSYGWSLSGGASVVSGNESYYLHSRYDSHSLFLPVGSTATTPQMCMATSSSVIRFFVKGTSTLRVQVVERNLLGVVIGILDSASISGAQAWQPSPEIVNLDSLQGLVGVASVQLRFSAVSGPSQVDDVYVDPWASSN